MPKFAFVGFNMPPEDFERMAAMAKAAGQTRTAFIREALAPKLVGEVVGRPAPCRWVSITNRSLDMREA